VSVRLNSELTSRWIEPSVWAAAYEITADFVQTACASAQLRSIRDQEAQLPFAPPADAAFLQITAAPFDDGDTLREKKEDETKKPEVH